MTSDRNFVAAEGSDVLPAGAAIADYTCVVGQTNASDYVRAYFNKTTHKLVYHSALMAFEATEGDKVLSGEPIFMKGCEDTLHRRGDITRGFFVNVSERLSPEQPVETFRCIGLLACSGVQPLFGCRHYRAVCTAACSIDAFTE